MKKAFSISIIFIFTIQSCANHGNLDLNTLKTGNKKNQDEKNLQMYLQTPTHQQQNSNTVTNSNLNRNGNLAPLTLQQVQNSNTLTQGPVQTPITPLSTENGYGVPHSSLFPQPSITFSSLNTSTGQNTQNKPAPILKENQLGTEDSCWEKNCLIL